MKEIHKTKNIGGLRAAVLGANDGIVSTASLVIGVTAANASHGNVLIAAIAGLVPGSMAMNWASRKSRSLGRFRLPLRRP